MKAVLFYETATVDMDKIMSVYPMHEIHVNHFTKQGKIIGIGPYANPMEGSMAIFTDKASAEEFVKNDPFVLNGIVSKHTIKEWNDDML
ncbi:MAG: YciI family protein [Flavobacteriaceae bacterium]